MPTTRTCLDDRHQRVKVPSPLDRQEQLESTPRGQSLAIARQTLFATPTWNLYRWPVAIATAVLVWYTFRGVEWLLNFNDAPIGRFVVRFPVAIFAGFAVFRTLPRTYPRLAAARTELSEARICVVCLTDLDKRPAAEDNCTVCPRCGCATRFSAA